MSAPIRKVRWVSLKPKGVLAVPDPNRKTNGGMFRYLVGNFLANQPGGVLLPIPLRNIPSEHSLSSSMESLRWQLPKNTGRARAFQ